MLLIINDESIIENYNRTGLRARSGRSQSRIPMKKTRKKTSNMVYIFKISN